MSQTSWQTTLLVRRYRALSLDLMQAFLPEARRDSLRVGADRQCDSTWFCRTNLEGGQPCYALGKRGQRWFGVRGKKGFPFGNHGLLQHVGIATFCALAGYYRVLPDEFTSQFENCHEKGMPAQAYCIDESDPKTLAWVFVDHASAADRFHRKLSYFIGRHFHLRGFQQLIDNGQLKLVIITAEEDRADQIRSDFERRVPLATPVSVIAIPGLLQFLL